MPVSNLISCLDHGFVRLVDSMGSDLSVVRAARVSYAAAWRAGENDASDAKLIRYLARNKHTTPFEAVVFTFEVKAPIFVLRQWHRHRTQSYNELSARYRELPEEFYVPHVDDIGQQSTSNKQMREIRALGDERDARLSEITKFQLHCEQAFKLYRELLDSSWPRELARCVLPMNVYSQMFVTLNLLNLMRFLGLRDHPHAQPEIQVYARAMKELARYIVPVSVAAWEEVMVA